MENNIIKKVIKREINERGLIFPLVKGVTKREEKVLKMRETKTLQFIGDKFGVSRQRIRKIEEKAKAKLDYQDRIIDDLAEKIRKEILRLL